MTREEAIEMLVNATYSDEWQGNEKLTTAHLMAIEALKEAEINCVHCPRYFETEDETGVHSHCEDLISRQDVYCILDKMMVDRPLASDRWVIRDIDKAIKSLPSAEAVPQSEQYKKGFEDAKRAFLVEYARESQNMRKRIAQLEVRLNAQKAISADRPRGEWIEMAQDYYEKVNKKGGGVNENTEYFIDDIACSECLTKFSNIDNETERFNFCPNCGADMRGKDE